MLANETATVYAFVNLQLLNNEFMQTSSCDTCGIDHIRSCVHCVYSEDLRLLFSHVIFL